MTKEVEAYKAKVQAETARVSERLTALLHQISDEGVGLEGLIGGAASAFAGLVGSALDAAPASHRRPLADAVDGLIVEIRGQCKSMAAGQQPRSAWTEVRFRTRRDITTPPAGRA